MAQYTLINPLQQILTFDEYKKALKKAEAFMEKHQFSTVEKKPRGRPKGTTKKPQPTEPVEKKKRGRPPKQKPETPAPKAPVGRPARKPDSYETINTKDFDTEHFGNNWFLDESVIARSLNKFFKEPENQFIRFKNGVYEIYDDDMWKVPISGYGKKAQIDPNRVVTDIMQRLIQDHDQPMSDGYNLDTDRPAGKKNMEHFFIIVDGYLKSKFGI